MNDCLLVATKAAELPANYRVECFYKSESLYHTAWATLTKDDLFYQIAYLSEVEKSCQEFLQPHYGIVYDNDHAIAAFYFQLVRFKGKQLLAFVSQEHKSALHKWLIEKPICAILEGIDKPLLVLGNLLQTNHGGIFFSPDITDAQQKADIVSTLCSKTQKECSAAAILITNIYASDTHFLHKLDNSFHEFNSEPDLQLILDKNWHNLEDYMQSLQSKYRVRAKKILKESAAISVRRLSLEEIEKNHLAIFQLNRNVMKHVKFSLGDISSTYFYDIAKYFGDKLVLNGYFADDELIGFSSMIIEQQVLNSHFIGMNYDYVNQHKLYNRILYDNLQVAIEHKMDVLKYGRTATEIKTTIGAKPLTMINFLKHRNRLVNWMVPRMLNMLKAPEFTVRHPFK